MKTKVLFLLIITGLLAGFTSCKKEGCTDPTATNYDEKAKKDDGSCIYNETTNNIVITDNGKGTGTTTWTKDNVYILDGLVFVNDGQTLTIEAGTVIKGKPGTGENASALIVARGGKIIANGTADEPIIFTAEADDLNGSVDIKAKGLWGGVIILGNGRLNSSPGESAIEGIPTSEPRGIYGGNDDTDNSGTLRYVSIRHGGTDIGEGNEINGLTLGAVGSGTTIEYVEVISNADDGIEFFGGAPRLKHVIVAFCGDDAFDYDEGFRGKGQFWVAIQDPDEGDRVGEHDGGTNPETGTPYAIPEIFNVTYVGKGVTSGKRMITFRDNAGGKYKNSIFVNQEHGVDIELLAGEGTFDRFQAGELELTNNIFYNISDGTASGIFAISFGDGASANPDSASAATDFANYFLTANNVISDPGFSITTSLWNIIPNSTTDVTSNLATYADSWFDAVNYKGAFAPGGTNWAKSWTLIGASGLQ
ncbi:MAG: hypothetical protein Kow0068_02750 [Marinilabiliales bacterium]